jgi:quercetin dioxygenase-like cupin family protein
MSSEETEGGAASDEGAPAEVAEATDAAEEETPHFVEVWNDYDPSQRFAAIFPLSDAHGATGGTVGYYIIEPGKHTGVHHDNAEEIAFVTEGEGEVFQIGNSTKMLAGKFYVFPAGADHDIYAQGSTAMRLLSFFPVTEIVSTFQQAIYPVGTTELTSNPPKPVVQEFDPDNLPFSPEEMGLGGEEVELSETQRLLGMTEPGVRPEKTKVTIYSPSEGKVESYMLDRDGNRVEIPEGEDEPAAEAATESEPGEG